MCMDRMGLVWDGKSVWELVWYGMDVVWNACGLFFLDGCDMNVDAILA